MQTKTQRGRPKTNPPMNRITLRVPDDLMGEVRDLTGICRRKENNPQLSINTVIDRAIGWYVDACRERIEQGQPLLH